jgi:hypothetical protein
MRLIELRPKWVLPTHLWSSDEPYWVGLSFDCPVCHKRLAVLFSPPIDPHNLREKYGWPEMNTEQIKWNRTGDTFDNLTLNPSINFMPHDWHGNITSGEITTSDHPA